MWKLRGALIVHKYHDEMGKGVVERYVPDQIDRREYIGRCQRRRTRRRKERNWELCDCVLVIYV
jgi:hypothetical protein